MEKKFGAPDWKSYIPVPVWKEHSEYLEFYNKAWELAFDHIKSIPGMPQNPYMDEAFCDTQIWIWDTCFMTLFCKYAREIFPGVESFKNFYAVLNEKKSLPEVIPTENEPSWTYAVPGEPYAIKLHIADNPPLLAWAEYENALMSGDKEYLKNLLYNEKALQNHYEWFENLKGNLDGSVSLENVHCPICLIAEENGYKWEGGRSGMDNTPRGRKGETAPEERPNNPDMYWLDAICQQALSANMIARMFAILGDTEKEAEWNKKFESKKEIINNLYWDDEDKFYYDIDCNTHDFYKVMTVASYWTMTSETATKERAELILKQLDNPETLGGVVPFLSLSRADGDYSSKGKYWRGGVWLPTAYASLKGIANYGYYNEAHSAGLKLFEHMYKTYIGFEPHTIWECYNPEKPEPSLNTRDNGLVRPDFCGWSALGPISVYIEYVLGFHTIDAFENVVKWSKNDALKGEVGIKNLRFGDTVTDIVADGSSCRVVSNKAYTLEINGKKYEISEGVNNFEIA